MKSLLSRQTRNSINRKTVVGLVLVGVAVVGVIVFSAWKGNVQNWGSQCRMRPEGPLYQEATVLIDESLITDKSRAVAAKIEKDKGYNTDVNCLYPLISYYIVSNDTEKVEKLFKSFGRAYGDDRSVNKMYKNYDVKSYKDVKKKVELYLDNPGGSNAFYY